MTTVEFWRDLARRPAAWAVLLGFVFVLAALPSVYSWIEPAVSESGLRAWQVFGSGGMRNASDFTGGEAVAVLGRYTLDLTEAAMRDNGGAAIRATAVVGLLEIKVPKDWEVRVQGLPLMGGYRDLTDHAGAGAGRLLVHGLAVFGVVRVTN